MLVKYVSKRHKAALFNLFILTQISFEKKLTIYPKYIFPDFLYVGWGNSTSYLLPKNATLPFVIITSGNFENMQISFKQFSELTVFPTSISLDF